VYFGQPALFQSGFFYQDHFAHPLFFVVTQVYLILENDKALDERKPLLTPPRGRV
jgi:hypothetical protein